MRLYRRADFLKLPEGTIYAKGQPQFFGGIEVKGESLPNDFITLGLVWFESGGDCGGEKDLGYRFDNMLENGASYPMQSSYGRDGCFDDEDIFLVWEEADLLKLREYVDAALSLPTLSKDKIDG